jgi:hypothetical protein
MGAMMGNSQKKQRVIYIRPGLAAQAVTHGSN